MNTMPQNEVPPWYEGGEDPDLELEPEPVREPSGEVELSELGTDGDLEHELGEAGA